MGPVVGGTGIPQSPRVLDGGGIDVSGGFLIVLPGAVGVIIAGVMVCWWALHRWQARVLLRERGGRGFEVSRGGENGQG
jgi:hypothetical protein